MSTATPNELHTFLLNRIKPVHLPNRTLERMEELKHNDVWVLRQLITQAAEREQQLRADVLEWACVDCNTVYPGPPQPGFACVVCPKCKGTTAPRATVERLALERRIEALTQPAPSSDYIALLDDVRDALLYDQTEGMLIRVEQALAEARKAAPAKPAAPEAPISEQQAHDPMGDRWHSLTCDGTCSPPCPAATTASASIDTPEYRNLLFCYLNASLTKGARDKAQAALTAHINAWGRAPAPSRDAAPLADAVRKALEPFAAIADQYAPQEDDSFSILSDYPHGLIKPPTLGQCRAARAVLAQQSGPQAPEGGAA